MVSPPSIFFLFPFSLSLCLTLLLLRIPFMSGSETNTGPGVAEATTGVKTDTMTVFRPPVVRRGVSALNRALFTKQVSIAAAAVNENSLISRYRGDLAKSRELLDAERVSPVAPHPDGDLAKLGRKCLLLNLGVKAEGWTYTTLQRLGSVEADFIYL